VAFIGVIKAVNRQPSQQQAGPPVYSLSTGLVSNLLRGCFKLRFFLFKRFTNFQIVFMIRSGNKNIPCERYRQSLLTGTFYNKIITIDPFRETADLVKGLSDPFQSGFQHRSVEPKNEFRYFVKIFQRD